MVLGQEGLYDYAVGDGNRALAQDGGQNGRCTTVGPERAPRGDGMVLTDLCLFTPQHHDRDLGGGAGGAGAVEYDLVL